MKYIIIIALLLFGCKSAKELAAERAQMERDYLRSLQGRYADSNYIAFPITLPGGVAQLRLQAGCPDFDSGAIKSEGGQLTLQAPCPPVTLNADSLIRNSNVYKAALFGRRLAEAKTDSLLQANVVLKQANAVLKSDRDKFQRQRNTAYWWLAGIISAAGIWMFIKVKTGAISGLFKGIFK